MSKLSRNIVANLLGQVFVLLMAFVGTRFVFRGLGGDALGIIIFTLTLGNVLRSVLELGVCSTVVREIAAHRTDDPEYVVGVIGMASLLYWAGFAALTAGTWFAAPPIVHHWIHLKNVDPSVAIRVVRTLGGGAFLALPRALYASIFRGLERMELNNGLDLAAGALQQCGTIGIVAFGGSLITVAYWIVACFVISIGLYLIVLIQLLPAGAFFPRWMPDVIERNREFSRKMMWISILTIAHLESDKVLVSKFLAIAATGYYGFVASLANRAALVTTSIAGAAYPSISNALSESNFKAALSEYRKLHDLVCFCTVPLFAGIVFVAPWLFTYMFDARVARSLMQPTILLCIANYLNATLNMPYIMSLACGKPGIALKSASMALWITLPATTFLIYRFGLSGAGWSWVFYQIFACIYAIPGVCRECLQSPPTEWFWHLGRIVLLAVATYGCVGAFLAVWGSNSLAGMAIGYAIASIGFLIGAGVLVGDELKHAVVGFGRHFLRMSRPVTA